MEKQAFIYSFTECLGCLHMPRTVGELCISHSLGRLHYDTTSNAPTCHSSQLCSSSSLSINRIHQSSNHTTIPRHHFVPADSSHSRLSTSLTVLRFLTPHHDTTSSMPPPHSSRSPGHPFTCSPFTFTRFTPPTAAI